MEAGSARAGCRDARSLALPRAIEIAASRGAAQAWFLGMNPGLGDALPAEVIAGEGEEGDRRVMKAARSFLAAQ